MDKNNSTSNKTYSYTSRKDKIRLKIIDPEKPTLDGMESICNALGADAKRRAEYYDSYDFSLTDPEGSYTGTPSAKFGAVPVQDADDL